MRTDCTIDRKQVICRNSSHIGFSKVKARVGDIVVYGDGSQTQFETRNVGRVIGRIVYAPALDANEQPIRNWLLVAVLSNDLTFVMERWVNPEHVTQVFEPQEKTQKMLAFFFSPDFKKESAHTLRRWTGSGFSTPKENEDYMARIRKGF